MITRSLPASAVVASSTGSLNPTRISRNCQNPQVIHPVLREGIAAILASEADLVLVAEAGNGREAIEQFRIHRPDITLMDLQMPVSGELLGGQPDFTGNRAAKLRKWAESHFRDAPRGSETMGAAKHAAMEKLRVIS